MSVFLADLPVREATIATLAVEFFTLEREMRELSGDVPDKMSERSSRYLERIATTPARSPADKAIKLLVAAMMRDDWGPRWREPASYDEAVDAEYLDDRMAKSLLLDARGLVPLDVMTAFQTSRASSD